MEKGVDVCGRDVDDGAEDGGVAREDVEGFGGGDGAGVACFSELLTRRGDEVGEELRAGEVVEDGFVADDDHFYGIPFSGRPGNYFVDLGLGEHEDGVVDVDAEDEFELVVGGCGADVFEDGAVGCVDADGGEALFGYRGYVGVDGGSCFAG